MCMFSSILMKIIHDNVDVMIKMKNVWEKQKEIVRSSGTYVHMYIKTLASFINQRLYSISVCSAVDTYKRASNISSDKVIPS